MMKFFACCLFTLHCFLGSSAQPSLMNSGTVQVQYSPNHPANTFIPSKVLGAAFDGHPKGDIDLILTPENIKAMLAVGLNPVSYRLRTELSVEAWHWNPQGTWSETGKKQGYWTSESHTSKDIQLSNGYRLPRRGNTHDQADNDDYSRLDDGDTKTFWKSNPYLDEYYTKESNALHPQWIIVDLGKLMPVNAIRIQWGNPYALSCKVDYALDIGTDYFDPLQPGLWSSFSKGIITDLHGENKIIPVSFTPVKVRFVRITMIESSHTAEEKSTDVRDWSGFAVKEIEAGLLDTKEKFHDWVKHAEKNNKQSVMHVSSTDPWHRAIDIDRNTEQVGVDRFFASGLINHQPAMMPVALLYDTPDNMVALVQYMLAKHYPVQELEMGEEPEGQLIDPEDYATLYYQWASVIKKIAPSMQLGGPCFASLATTEDDEYAFTERKWTTHFLKYLQDHKSLSAFNFFSFEWYPFDDICAPTAPQLAAAPQMLTTALKDFRDHILPVNTPIYVTEYGYSAHSGRPEVDIEGALMYADILGRFLTIGGDKAFLYGYEPTYPDHDYNCEWGNNMLFGMDEKGKIIYHTAAYYGMQMITQHWAQPAGKALEIYPATCSIRNKQQQPLITAYAIRRPDNKWSVVLINKDPERSWNVEVNILNTASGIAYGLNFPLQTQQYSKLQYHWKNEGSEGHPSLSLPPVEKMMNKDSFVNLPPYSLTVITE